MAVATKIIPDDIILIGDRVDLVVKEGIVYRAMIEDRIENGPFLVAIPSRKGAAMRVAHDDTIYLVFYRDTGRYIAQMQVVAFEKRGTLQYMWILQKTKAQKNQRREAFRLQVEFDVSIFEYTEDTEEALAAGEKEEKDALLLEKANCRDVSNTGIALLTKKQYILEDLYILEMQMEGFQPGYGTRQNVYRTPILHLTAAVKRCVKWRTGNLFHTGMRFIGLSRNTSEEISKFVLNEQQRQIRMRRHST